MRKELTVIAKNNEKLPEGWDWSSLGKVANVVAGNPAPQGKQFFEDGTYPFVRVQDMGRLGSQRRLSQTNDYINDKAIKKLKLIPNGAVLFTKSGASTLLNQRAILGSDMYVVSHIAAAIPHDGIKSEWLYYWLKTVDFNYIAHATTLPSLPLSKAREIPVPVAPENEQARIVAEIEKQFSRLDEAVDNLKRVKANLKRYKASVLKAAVEGKLTEEWRDKNKDVEPANKLLERILSEHRIKWEESELARLRERAGRRQAKMRTARKKPKDDKWKNKYKEPDAPNLENLPPIPNKWTWATLPQLGELNRGKSKHRPRNDPILYDGPYPFIQTGDIRHATGIISQYTQTYSEKGLKQSRLWPKNTLCITIAANIADTAVLGFDACFPDSVVGFIPDTEYIDVRFVEYFTRTAKEDLDRYAPATAQKNINMAILSDVAMPLPPKKEQQIIIDEIEKCLSVAEGIELIIEQNFRRAEYLRQSILKKAFSGKLIL